MVAGLAVELIASAGWATVDLKQLKNNEIAAEKLEIQAQNDKKALEIKANKLEQKVELAVLTKSVPPVKQKTPPPLPQGVRKSGLPPPAPKK